MNVRGVDLAARGRTLGSDGVATIHKSLLEQLGQRLWKWREWFCVERFIGREVAFGQRRILIARRVGLCICIEAQRSYDECTKTRFTVDLSGARSRRWKSEVLSIEEFPALNLRNEVSVDHLSPIRDEPVLGQDHHTPPHNNCLAYYLK